MNFELPTVPCVYCGQPTTYTGTKHCDPCHQATRAPLDTLRKIIAEADEQEIVEKILIEHVKYTGRDLDYEDEDFVTPDHIRRLVKMTIALMKAQGDSSP